MAVTSHLKALQALELAVRTGSLKRAADVLSITPAAVGQRVKVLEDYLGIDLLVRGRSGLKPTPALSTALEHLTAAFRELELVADALDLQRGQEIHIAVASDFAELWLKPRLGRFRHAHPNILFCINGEGETPLRLGPVDCEISFGPGTKGASNNILFHDFLIPISSPENIDRLAQLKKRDRLEGFPLLHLDFYSNDPAAPDWPDWIKMQRLKRTAPGRGMRFQRITPAVEAVLANAGLTICGLALISELIDGGQVSLPFPISTGVWTEHAYHARFRSDALIRPQVRRFKTWLATESAATNAWLTQFATPERVRNQ
ncbi:MAG: LysR substrate-binding domain-containing protein [Gammaproteobacteria bacterium]